MPTIETGSKAFLKRIFRQKDYDLFARIIRDDNPIHVDVDFCKATRFGKTLAHGMHLYANLCRILSTQMPGPGTIQIKQDFTFPTGTFTDQEVLFETEVTGFSDDKKHARIKTECITPQGKGATGQTLVILPGQKAIYPGLDENMCQPVESDTKSFKQMEIGQDASCTRAFTKDDLEAYASLTGDHNPVTLSELFAKKAGLDRCIVPGPMISGMFSSLLGTKLPGRGVNWLKQDLHFPNPAYVGEKITARVTIVRFRPEKALINLYGTCETSDNKVVCQAKSLMLAQNMEIS